MRPPSVIKRGGGRCTGHGIPSNGPKWFIPPPPNDHLLHLHLPSVLVVFLLSFLFTQLFSDTSWFFSPSFHSFFKATIYRRFAFIFISHLFLSFSYSNWLNSFWAFPVKQHRQNRVYRRKSYKHGFGWALVKFIWNINNKKHYASQGIVSRNDQVNIWNAKSCSVRYHVLLLFNLSNRVSGISYEIISVVSINLMMNGMGSFKFHRFLENCWKCFLFPFVIYKKISLRKELK